MGICYTVGDVDSIEMALCDASDTLRDACTFIKRQQATFGKDARTAACDEFFEVREPTADALGDECE